MHLKAEVRLVNISIDRHKQVDFVCRLKPTDIQVLTLQWAVTQKEVACNRLDARYPRLLALAPASGCWGGVCMSCDSCEFYAFLTVTCDMCAVVGRLYAQQHAGKKHSWSFGEPGEGLKRC